MSQNVTEFEWTEQREDAAFLVAGDRLSDEKISAKLGIDRRTLARWKDNPAFDARVEEHRKAWQDRVMKRGIASRQARVRALNERWEKLETVIEERAADPSIQAVPGGKTGLIVKTVKLAKVYDVLDGQEGVLLPTKLTELVEEYAVDTGLLKEMRDLEKQAAQELGQWTEKRESTGDTLTRIYVGVPQEHV